MRSKFFALALAAATCSLGYSQTFYGPGGMILDPTAYNPAARTLSVSSSFFNVQDSGKTWSVYPTSVTYAVSDRLELGGVYAHVHRRVGSTDQGGLYLKQNLVTESLNAPQISLVLTSITGDGSTVSTGTVMASKDLNHGLRLHAGLRGANFSDGRSLDGNLIGGFDEQVIAQFKLIVEGETRLHQYSFGSWAAGIQYSGPLTVTVGVISDTSRRANFFVGIGYLVGK